MYSVPTSTTLAALTMASAASTDPMKPRVSTMPSASRAVSIGIRTGGGAARRPTLAHLPRRLWRGRRVSGYHVGAQGYAHLQPQIVGALVGLAWSPPAALAGCGGSEDTAPAQGTMAVQLSRAAGGARQPGRRDLPVHRGRRRRRRWAPARSSSISSTPTASRCGPTTTTRRPRPRRGSRARPSNTAGRCSRPSIPTWARPRSSAGCTTPRRATGCKLSGTEAGGRAYEVAQLELLPQTENIFLIFKDGWHAVETAGDNSMVEWQWTQEGGHHHLPQPAPRRRALLPGRQPRQGGDRRPPGRDPARRPGAADRGRSRPMRCPCTRFRISAAAMGSGEMVELRLVVDQTFVPALEPGAHRQRPARARRPRLPRLRPAGGVVARATLMEFRCRLGTAGGQVIEGVYVAPSEAHLRRELEDKGLHVLSLAPRGGVPGPVARPPHDQARTSS